MGKTVNEDSTGANVFGEGETDASRLYKMGEGEFLSEKLPFGASGCEGVFKGASGLGISLCGRHSHVNANRRQADFSSVFYNHLTLPPMPLV